MVLDPLCAELVLTTCLNELHSAGVRPAGIIYLRPTNVDVFRKYDLPMHPFEHQKRLDAEVAAVDLLLKDSTNGEDVKNIMIVRPFTGWTPAPRLRQLANVAGDSEVPCISLLRHSSQQHPGWNMQIQDCSYFLDGALVRAQSTMFCPRSFRQEYVELGERLNWPKTFTGSQHLPGLQYFDGPC